MLVQRKPYLDGEIRAQCFLLNLMLCTEALHASKAAGMNNFFVLDEHICQLTDYGVH